MKKELELVAEFHKKFQAPVADRPKLITPARSDLRYRLMNEEVLEYKSGVDKADLENIAKELTDILYAVYGTILEHGLQDKMEDIFTEVHRSNMTKDYSPQKMIKGENYSEAEIGKFLE